MAIKEINNYHPTNYHHIEMKYSNPGQESPCVFRYMVLDHLSLEPLEAFWYFSYVSCNRDTESD